jgi:hypothetical protein
VNMTIYVLISTIADYEGDFDRAVRAFTDGVYARIVALALNDLLDDWRKNGKNQGAEADAIIEKIRRYDSDIVHLELSYWVDEIELETTI